jgi:hypothetical protein
MMIDEISSYHQYRELQRMKNGLTTEGFRFCSILLSWLELDHYKRHWDGLHEKWVGCETFKQFMESSPPDGLGLGDKAKEEIKILERGGVPGAERILAAWYADQPLPKDDQKENPRNPNGRKGKESSNNITRLNRGTDTTYTLRRLARDAPEILSKVQSGELSVNQAAIAAGIRKKPTPEETTLKAFSRATERLLVLRSIVDTLTDSERQILKDWLFDE